MKKLIFALVAMVLFALVYLGGKALLSPAETIGYSEGSSVDSVRSVMLRSGIDSQRISRLVEYLRPLIFSPENERLLDDWYANNSKWIAFFGDAQNVVFCAKLIYEECKAANDLA